MTNEPWVALEAIAQHLNVSQDTLRVCYRTSHQIRKQADRLLPRQLQDVDENAEDRRGTVSVFNSPPPKILVADSQDQECDEVARWIKGLVEEGVRGHEIGIFVRDDEQIERGMAVAKAVGMSAQPLNQSALPKADTITVAPMHSAKGLEFRAVAVMACDDEVIPSQARIDALGDGADLEDLYNTERNLLYVACTRARDYLLVTGVDPASEFLEDLEA